MIIIIPLLQMDKLEWREIKWLIPDITEMAVEQPELKLGSWASEAGFLTIFCAASR